MTLKDKFNALKNLIRDFNGSNNRPETVDDLESLLSMRRQIDTLTNNIRDEFIPSPLQFVYLEDLANPASAQIGAVPAVMLDGRIFTCSVPLPLQEN